MAIQDLDLNQPVPMTDEEDEETLAAIDEGIADADAGLLYTAQEVREKLSRWNIKSSTPKPR
jgi:predicted transcriptional regulator